MVLVANIMMMLKDKFVMLTADDFGPNRNVCHNFTRCHYLIRKIQISLHANYLSGSDTRTDHHHGCQQRRDKNRHDLIVKGPLSFLLNELFKHEIHVDLYGY